MLNKFSQFLWLICICFLWPDLICISVLVIISQLTGFNKLHREKKKYKDIWWQIETFDDMSWHCMTCHDMTTSDSQRQTNWASTRLHQPSIKWLHKAWPKLWPSVLNSSLHPHCGIEFFRLLVILEVNLELFWSWQKIMEDNLESG